MLAKILVCLDGSKEAEQILTHLLADSAFNASELVLLRVISLPEISVQLGVPGATGVSINTAASLRQMSAKEAEARRYLESLNAPLQQTRLNIKCEVIPGSPGEAIVDYARENGITLIALGTHGHGVTRRFFVGSTADYVIRHTNLPVLTIRPNI